MGKLAQKFALFAAIGGGGVLSTGCDNVAGVQAPDSVEFQSCMQQEMGKVGMHQEGGASINSSTDSGQKVTTVSSKFVNMQGGGRDTAGMDSSLQITYTSSSGDGGLSLGQIVGQVLGRSGADMKVTGTFSGGDGDFSIQTDGSGGVKENASGQGGLARKAAAKCLNMTL